MAIKSLIFDFDGLILDTETPDIRIWQAIYREYGQELPVGEWSKIIGGHAVSHFDAAEHLAALTGGGVDIPALRLRQKLESDAIMLIQPPMPGVTRLLEEAEQAGLSLAIASSSEHAWVDTHLSRLGLYHRFPTIICSEEVAPGRTKPYPDLYLKALQALGVKADEAIVFEDSLNGVRAARAAGIFVVAVPNQATAMLGVDGANLTLKSLSDFRLDDFTGRM